MIKNTHWAAWLLLLAGPALADAPWPTPPQAEVPGAGQLELLRHGDVAVDTLQETRQGGASRVQALFRATPQQIWEVLGDCTANFRFVQGLQECEILEETADHAVTRQVAKKHWLAPTMEYRFETRREPFRWIMIRLIDGDLKQLQGSWRFHPLDGGDLVLVTHRIRVQPSTPAPSWLIRRTLHRDLGEMLACLRFVAGASLDAEGRESDRAQCPKPRSAD